RRLRALVFRRLRPEGEARLRRLPLIYLRGALGTVRRTVTSAVLTLWGSNRARARGGRDAQKGAIFWGALFEVLDPVSASQSSQVIAAPPPRPTRKGSSDCRQHSVAGMPATNLYARVTMSYVEG